MATYTSGMHDKMTYGQFLAKVDNSYCHLKDEWRYGQVLFNALLAVRPELAELVRGSNLDPFYKEIAEIKPEFWTLIAKRW